MAKLGGSLLIVGLVSFVSIFVHLFNESTDQYLAALICRPGEELMRQESSRRKGTSNVMFCAEEDGKLRYESGRWVGILVGAFLGSIVLRLAGASDSGSVPAPVTR